MKEIWIPELISALLLLLFLFRPLIKGLWPLEGLNWFPVLAFGITLCLFPAYGFRPECVPLLLYFTVLALLNMPFRHKDDFHDQRLIFILPAALILALTMAVALIFAPAEFPAPATAPKIVTVQDERQNRNYTLHIFGPAENAARQSRQRRPLLLLIPPEAGGVSTVDVLCASLADRGFTVISYARQGFDSLTPAKLSRIWQSFRRGTVSKKANDFGQALETGRREDLEFLLPYLRRNGNTIVPGTDPETLIVAGCGAGGAAAAYLAADPAFIAQNKQLRGIVAVESGFWSVYRPEERSTLPVPASANWFKKAWITVQNWFAGLPPLKMAGLGTVPRPGVPALYLVSDHALEPQAAQTRYAAAFNLLRNTAPAPAALIALKGAGPLDYTDYPAEYPLYSALFPGQEKKAGLRAQDCIEDTAAVITGFAASVLRAPDTLHNTPVHTEIHLSTRSWEDPSWNLSDLRFILNP
jgi:dienelactone hydrolase